MSFNIAFVLFPAFEELDFAGPYEVFGVATRLEEDWQVFTVAEERMVEGAHGL